MAISSMRTTTSRRRAPKSRTYATPSTVSSRGINAVSMKLVAATASTWPAQASTISGSALGSKRNTSTRCTRSSISSVLMLFVTSR